MTLLMVTDVWIRFWWMVEDFSKWDQWHKKRTYLSELSKGTTRLSGRGSKK
jgi:hypothetical protein